MKCLDGHLVTTAVAKTPTMLTTTFTSIGHCPHWTNRQIADAVSREDEQVDGRKVRAVLDRYAKDPQAFGVEVEG